MPSFADAPASSIRPHAAPATLALTPASDPATTGVVMIAVSDPAVVQRPRPRPDTVKVTLSTQAVAVPLATVESSFRPKVRPPLIGGDDPAPETDTSVVAAGPTVLSSPRPEERPETGTGAIERVETVAAVRILPGKTGVFGRKGSVCGVPGIKGEEIAPITSRVRGCGIADPVRVTSVDGVQLSPAATIDCGTAIALNRWVDQALQPAFKRDKVAELRIAASYACRPRNNVKGAKLSEHGKGNAVDIGAIVLESGKTISVESDWRKSAGKPMKAAYRGACGIFGTTLGPDGDRYHKNHMHFDTADQRNGPYCH
ncbi:extensin-like domain-containing protein [Allitabrizicola rongguiensis]|uniref:extensin-like domain-containing protein n=1 Tax=Alitabrizicola rongguiensis TaxID=2909234 RepID=UPI001F1EE64F|nr:extensin family protein [Tabrizicola rongguiensis]